MRMFHRIIVVAALLGGCDARGTSDSNQISVASAKSQALETYERYSYDASTALPDGDPAGVLIGPLRTSESGAPIGKVVLVLDMSHSYTGDVVAALCYDADNDGQVDVKVPVDLFRFRADASTTREGLAYPMQLEGSYFFRDDNPAETESWNKATGEAKAETELPPSRAFSVLRGLRSGGSFYLAMADTSARNLGSVNSWSVLLQKEHPGLVQHARRRSL